MAYGFLSGTCSSHSRFLLADGGRRGQCKCRAHPTNPVMGDRAAGDLMLANIADAMNATTTAEVTARARRPSRPARRPASFGPSGAWQ